MARVSRVEISCPNKSYDNLYWPRYPNGNKPGGLAGAASVSLAVAAVLRAGVQLNGSVLVNAAATGDLLTQTATNQLIYANGARGPLWQNDFSFGASPPVVINDTTHVEPGQTSSLKINANSAWQPVTTNWAGGGIGPYGADISNYAYLQFDLWTATPSHQFDIAVHYDGAVAQGGADVSSPAYVFNITEVVGALTANTWNLGIRIPLALLGCLGMVSMYKFYIRDNGGGVCWVTNAVMIPGQFGWVYNGGQARTWNGAGYNRDSSLPLNGFTDVSTNATLNYAQDPSGLLPNAPEAPFGCAVTGLANPGSAIQSTNVAKVSITAAGGAWRVKRTTNLGLSSYDTFTFAALPTLTGWAYTVQMLDTTGAPIGTAVNAAAWTAHDFGIDGVHFTVYAIPLTTFGLGAPATIGGISIKDASGRATNVFYLSGMGFYGAFSQQVKAALAGGAQVATSALAQLAGPTTGVTTFNLKSVPGGTNLPFTLGHPFRRGDVPSGSFLTATGVNGFQADVKNTWSDGSVKFAILSGIATLLPNSPLQVTLKSTSTPPSGAAPTLAALRAALTSGSVAFTGFGTIDVPTVIAGAPFRTNYNSGAQMSEWHWRAPVGSDPFLECWFFIRLYAGSAIEIELCVENGHLNTASPITKAYTVTVTYNSSQRYTAPLTHYYQSRWSRVDWYGTDPQIVPAHDTQYMMSTLLVPNYGFLGITAADLNSFTTSYTPFSLPNLPQAMGNTGAQDFIGLLMNWDAAYLTSGADSRAYNAVLAAGRGLGTYQIHFRDETTNLPLAFGTYPHLVVNQNNNNISANAPSSTNTFTPQGSGVQSPGTWDFPHAPSPGYMAYMLSGRRVFIDELQFATTAHYLSNGDGVRQNSQCIFESTSAGTVRGAAWNLRTLANTIAATPDSESLRSSFQSAWASNMAHYAGLYCYGTLGINGAPVGNAKNNLGVVLSYLTNGPSTSEYNSGSGRLWEAGWMQAFLQASIGWAWDMEPTFDVTSRQQHQDFRDFLYRGAVGMFGDDSGFNYRRAAVYAICYTSTEQSVPVSWLTSWAAVKTAYEAPITGAGSNNRGALAVISGTGTMKQHDSDLDLTNGQDSSTWAEGFIANQMPALAYAVWHSAPGALAGWNRMAASSSFAFAQQCNDLPVWGVVPRVDTAAWYAAIAHGKWAVAPGTSAGQAGVKWDPQNPAGQNIGNGDSWTPWSSAIMNKVGAYLDALFVWGDHLCNFGGGHGDYGGNEVYGFGPLNSLSVDPNWKRWTNPTIPAPIDTARDSSGNPVSRHDYDQIGYSQYQNSLIAAVLGPEFTQGGSSAGQSDQFKFSLPNTRNGGGWSQIPSTVSVGVQPYGTYFYDPVTDMHYFLICGQGIQPQQLIALDLTRNRAAGWSHIANKGNTSSASVYGNNNTGAFDPVRRIACIVGADLNGFMFCDFRDPINNDFYLPTTTGAALPAGGADVSVVHDDVNDRFVVYNRTAGTLIFVSPPFSGPYQGGNAWTVTSVVPTGLLPVPDQSGGSGHPIFHKFNFVRGPNVCYIVNAAPSDAAGSATGSGLVYVYKP